MSATSKLNVAVGNTQNEYALDVSEIMNSLDSYSKNDEIQSEVFQICDLSIHFSFYPKGYSTSPDGYCAIYLVDKSGKDNDDRKWSASFQCGDKFYHVSDKIKEIGNGFGSCQFCKIEDLSKHPLIQINIKIANDPLLVIYPAGTPSVKNQNQKLYNLNKIYGDVTLIVKKQENEDASVDQTFATDPPKKKRKLNPNVNNNNNQQNEDNLLKINGLLLRSASSVFDNMLTNNMMEKENKTITIYSESVEDVDNMIYFMITNELRINSNALNIIRLAHLYEMKRLFYECINKLLKEVNVNNFVDTVSTFDRYEINTGYQQLIDFGKTNIDKLKEKDQFSRLQHSFRCAALGTATKS